MCFFQVRCVSPRAFFQARHPLLVLHISSPWWWCPREPKISPQVGILHRIRVFTHHSHSSPCLLQSCILVSIISRACPSPGSPLAPAPTQPRGAFPKPHPSPAPPVTPRVCRGWKEGKAGSSTGGERQQHHLAQFNGLLPKPLPRTGSLQGASKTNM